MKPTSGRDAVRKHGRGPSWPGGNYGFNGSPSYPAATGSVGGMKTIAGRGEGATRSFGMRPDELSRSSVMTSASVRRDVYKGPGRSEATGGNPSAKSRAPISYRDHEGQS
jgi:hypothetical protein